MKTPAASSKKRHRAPAAGPHGKVFKSGNSAALRLPAGLRLPVGKVFALTPTATGFVAVDTADLAKRQKALAELFGSVPDFPHRES